MVKLPKFKNERELGEFFDTHDSTEFFGGMPEETEPIAVAEPRKQQIALRLDRSTIDKAKRIAKSKGIGYQTLIRMWIVERIEAELKRAS